MLLLIPLFKGEKCAKCRMCIWLLTDFIMLILLQRIEEGLFSLILFVTLSLLISHSSLSPFWCSAASSLFQVLWTIPSKQWSFLVRRLSYCSHCPHNVLEGYPRDVMYGCYWWSLTANKRQWRLGCVRDSNATTINLHRQAIGTYRFYCIIHCVYKTGRKKKTAVSDGEKSKMKAQPARWMIMGTTQLPNYLLSWRCFRHMLMLYFEIHCVNNKERKKQSCSEWCWSGWNGSSIDDFKKDHAWSRRSYCASWFLQKKRKVLHGTNTILCAFQ